MLPLNVIEDAAANLADYEGCGQSVMEMSHRSKEFGKIIEDAEANLREIMNIPDNYKVMFFTRWRNSSICNGAVKPA